VKKIIVILMALGFILLNGFSSGQAAQVSAAGDCAATAGVNYCAGSIADVIGQIGTGTGSIRPKMMSISIGF
jgi:hypothetical protein